MVDSSRAKGRVSRGIRSISHSSACRLRACSKNPSHVFAIGERGECLWAPLPSLDGRPPKARRGL